MRLLSTERAVRERRRVEGNPQRRRQIGGSHTWFWAPLYMVKRSPSQYRSANSELLILAEGRTPCWGTIFSGGVLIFYQETFEDGPLTWRSVISSEGRDRAGVPVRRIARLAFWRSGRVALHRWL